jgi:GTPase SAR1 family protein
VSNGHQLVAFVATRSDGTPPLEGRCLVFVSLEQMLDSFLDLWQALSRPAMLEHRLQQLLLGYTRPAIPDPLSASIHLYPGVQRRNTFQQDLQILSELVLEDVSRAPELETQFLKDTYCESGALSQYAMTTKAILRTRYAALFEAEEGGPTMIPATSKAGIAPELLAESLSRRPILLLGDVGVGKSMFIKHLTKVEAAGLFQDAISLYLDFGSAAALTQDLRTFITNEIVRQLRQDHGIDVYERNFVHGVYDAKIKQFRKGIYGDLVETSPDLYRQKELEFLGKLIEEVDEHLRASLHHIAYGRKKQIVVFLDNADQRDEQTQQAVFLIAHELAQRWPVLVFVALRPETFHRSKKYGALSGYHAKAFTIAPPRVDKVLERRLVFALKITSGEIPIQKLGHVSAHLKSLDALIRVFTSSLAANTDLAACIDNISGGNIRLALDLVRQFFGSGHVNTGKIHDLYVSTGSYTVPLHEFLRAIIYQDSHYYDSASSPLANLFHLSEPDPREHFIAPLLIAAVEQLADKEGFSNAQEVYNAVQGIGFRPEQVDAAVALAVERGLVEMTGRRIPQPGQRLPSQVRITTVGAYHLHVLSGMFTYVDAVVVDTPILDPKIREGISAVDDVSDRLTRAEHFQSYLDSCWRKFAAPPPYFNWVAASANLTKEIRRIRERAGANKQVGFDY